MKTELTKEDKVIMINKVGMFAESDYRVADRADASIMSRAQYHPNKENVMQGRHLMDPVRVRA